MKSPIRLEQIEGKDVFIVEHHHFALIGWAEVRRRLGYAPALLSFDRHTDTLFAFSGYLGATKRLTDDDLVMSGRTEKKVIQECQKYSYSAESIEAAVTNLRNDEHIDAAIRIEVIKRAFIISHDCNGAVRRNAEGTFDGYILPIYVIPLEMLDREERSNLPDEREIAGRGFESRFLRRLVSLISEVATADGEPDWRVPGYILDIDLDYFRTKSAISPTDTFVFHKIIREAEAITIATEPTYVRSGWLDEEQISSDELLQHLKMHIQSALKSP